uniref:tRNA-yW synthesizing protein 5 n=1 Tax=Dromaius novaehollandiae TaxID=8790 RepID=A0A8C4J8B7_DRONO
MEQREQSVELVASLAGVTRERFLRDIYPRRKPVVLKGMELGTCTTKWTVDYLSQAEGSKEVKIHVSTVPQMDFLKLCLLIHLYREQLKSNTQSTFCLRMKSTICDPWVKILERILQISESSFLFWQKIFRFQSILKRNSFSLVSSASVQQDCSCGHTMM